MRINKLKGVLVKMKGDIKTNSVLILANFFRSHQTGEINSRNDCFTINDNERWTQIKFDLMFSMEEYSFPLVFFEII